MELSNQWRAFPGTRFYPEHRLMTWHPYGVVDALKAESIARWLEVVEPELGSFSRFIDLSQVDRLDLLGLRRWRHRRKAPDRL